MPDYVKITEEGDAFVDLSGLTQEQAPRTEDQNRILYQAATESSS